MVAPSGQYKFRGPLAAHKLILCVYVLHTYVILGTDDPDTIASALVEAKLIDSRNVVVGNTNQQYVHGYLAK